nr:hypothetical protein [Actinomycetota bacterium]
EPDRAAGDLVAALSAGADWPGRPKVLQLSGGRDSRLILGAALAAGVDCEAVTAGTPEQPDVRVARRLCQEAPLPHRLISADPGSALYGRTREVARVVGLTSGGTTSLEHASGYRIDPSAGALPLWLNGQGGEIARARYGNANGKPRDDLVPMLLAGVAGPARLLANPGRERLEREVRGAVEEALAAGVAPRDVPDVFYLLRRMSGWAAIGLGCGEYAKGDTIAPLWTRRLLDHELGLPLDERAREGFPTATLAALSPTLARLPFGEYVRLLRPDSAQFAPVHAQVRDAVAAKAAHPAWEVLERSYVEEILGREPRSLEEHEHRDVWRLATVFLGEEPP